jgi:hypothetical protein
MMAAVDLNYESIMVDIGLNGQVTERRVMKHSIYGKLFHSLKIYLKAQEKFLLHLLWTHSRCQKTY